MCLDSNIFFNDMKKRTSAFICSYTLIYTCTILVKMKCLSSSFQLLVLICILGRVNFNIITIYLIYFYNIPATFIILKYAFVSFYCIILTHGNNINTRHSCSIFIKSTKMHLNINIIHQ